MGIFRNKKINAYIGIIISCILFSGSVYADEVIPENVFEEIVTTNDEIVACVSVELPVISERNESVFDFILDPQGLINETGAIRYGGKNFEKNATLYFKNKSGDWDYSSKSDYLSVQNHSTVPVEVIVEAMVSSDSEIDFVDSNHFEEGVRGIYLALVDDKGLCIPLDEEGKATYTVSLDAEKEIIYESRPNEETGENEVVPIFEEVTGNTEYRFGLVGTCNSNAEWDGVFSSPSITVTWYVTPVIEEEQIESDEKEAIEEPDETVLPPDEEDTNDDSETTPGDENDATSPESDGDVLLPTPEQDEEMAPDEGQAIEEDSETNDSEEMIDMIQNILF